MVNLQKRGAVSNCCSSWEDGKKTSHVPIPITSPCALNPQVSVVIQLIPPSKFLECHYGCCLTVQRDGRRLIGYDELDLC